MPNNPTHNEEHGQSSLWCGFCGSSKYSREDHEDWSGEGLCVNSSWTLVSRSWAKGKSPLFAWKGCPFLVRAPAVCARGSWPWKKFGKHFQTRVQRRPQSLAAMQTNLETSVGALGRVVFLYRWSVFPGIGLARDNVIWFRHSVTVAMASGAILTVREYPREV